MSSSGLNAGTDMSVPLVNDIVNNALSHSSLQINRKLPQIIHILHFCLLDSLLDYAPDVVVNWLRSRLFGEHKSGMKNARKLASLSSCTWHIFRHFRLRLQYMVYITED